MTRTILAVLLFTASAVQAAPVRFALDNHAECGVVPPKGGQVRWVRDTHLNVYLDDELVDLIGIEATEAMIAHTNTVDRVPFTASFEGVRPLSDDRESLPYSEIHIALDTMGVLGQGQLGLASWHIEHGYIVGGWIIVSPQFVNRPFDLRLNLLLHELGHVLGLFEHSPDPMDVMYRFNVRNTAYAEGDLTRFDFLYPPTSVLLGNRFKVEATWGDFQGGTGPARAVPFGSNDSGLLWFFERNNWEVLIKVLDGCAINDHFWVFSAATTNVEYTLRITDVLTGVVQEYENPLGTAAPSINDTSAFATCSTDSSGVTVEQARPVEESPPPISLKNGCLPDTNTMCLADGRFSLTVEWRDYGGNTGLGQVVPITSDDSGLFWFFSSNNWEMLVKVLDACDFNGSFLFLGAATTDVEYTLTVTDTATGEFWQPTNPLGNPSAALIRWFETCGDGE